MYTLFKIYSKEKVKYSDAFKDFWFIKFAATRNWGGSNSRIKWRKSMGNSMYSAGFKKLLEFCDSER